MSRTTEERYDRQFGRLNDITLRLVKFVNDKDIQYGSSWRKRGGAGAFMVMARKWDRIETACEKETSKYNIFDVFKKEARQESILDDCLDLVGYLLILVEHMIEVGHVTKIYDFTPTITKSIVTGSNPETKLVGEIGLRSGMEHPFGFNKEEDVPLGNKFMKSETGE